MNVPRIVTADDPEPPPGSIVEIICPDDPETGVLNHSPLFGWLAGGYGSPYNWNTGALAAPAAGITLVLIREGYGSRITTPTQETRTP